MRLASQTRPQKTKWNPQVVSVSLNSDSSCVSTGSQRGFQVCQLSPNFRRHSFSMKGGIGICEMLDCSSLVAIVGGGDSPAFSSRRLRVFNTSDSSTICDMNFDSPVLAVRLNHKCLIVVLAFQVHIYNIDTMKVKQLLDTPPNPKGLCSLQTSGNASSSRVILCFPGSSDKGDVVVFDVAGQKIISVVEAHESPVQSIAVSSDGKLLATASTKGTLIRIFDLTQKNENVATFRRGVTTSVVATMRFNSNESLLCVGSKNGTVHVFDINAVINPEESRTTTLAHQASDGGGGGGDNDGGDGGGASGDAITSSIASSAVSSAASSAKAAATSLFSGLMQTLPISISSHRSSCSVSIEPDVAFICGFLRSDCDKKAAEEVEAETKVEVETASGKESLVVVTSTGIVSIHSMNFIDGTTTLEQQEFLIESENQEDH